MLVEFWRQMDKFKAVNSSPSKIIGDGSSAGRRRDSGATPTERRPGARRSATNLRRRTATDRQWLTHDEIDREPTAAAAATSEREAAAQGLRKRPNTPVDILRSLKRNGIHA